MSLFFRVIEGPQLGSEFPIEEGYILGRKGGPADIQLDDPKTSGSHARIEGTDRGMYLIDNNSKNGLRIDKEKIKKVVLKVGLQIWIGSTLLEVFEKRAVTRTVPPTTTQRPTTTKAETLPKTEILSNAEIQKKPTAQQMRTWRDILEEFTSLIEDQAEDMHKPLVPLEKVIRLSFLAGLQAETEWTLGYGPRRAGALSVDMPILEPNAPETCFEIIPTAQGVLFKTNHADIVMINNKSQGSVLLKSGDMIRIHDTIIEVGFPS